MNYKNIGINVRRNRENLGLTQTQLSDRTKLSQSLLSQIESGESVPSLKSLGKLAEALGVEVTELIEDSKND